ncbi:MAG: alpha/beta hydrolase [Gemmatimonadota bacterium]
MDRLALAMIRPPRKIHARNIAKLQSDYKIRSHGFTSLGQDLQGWFVQPEADAGGFVAVLVHGWGSSHGRMTVLAEPLLDAGIPVFLFDVRRHGRSYDAPYVTARHFRDDTVAAVREAKAAYPERPIALMGHSMGGSAAVLAVAEGAPVDALITVGAPADMWGVWAHYFDQKGLPGKWIVKAFAPFWRPRAGVSFRTLRTDDRVKEVEVPYLVIHGDRDRSVPPEHAGILADGAGVEPMILEGEGHNELLGREAVHRKILGFLEERL